MPVLTYHSVSIGPDNTLAITPEKLEKQMVYLSEQGYTTLAMQDFMDILEGKMKSPQKPVLIVIQSALLSQLYKIM